MFRLSKQTCVGHTEEILYSTVYRSFYITDKFFTFFYLYPSMGWRYCTVLCPVVGAASGRGISNKKTIYSKGCTAL